MTKLEITGTQGNAQLCCDDAVTCCPEDTGCCSEGQTCCTGDTACCSADSACCADDAEAECCSTETSATTKSSWHFPLLLSGLVATYFISDRWLNPTIAASLDQLSPEVAGAIAFFVSHSFSLLALLGAITGLAVLIRSFIPTEKVRAKVATVGQVTGHGVAASVGVVTPFCSCSAVPVFTGFVRGGVPVSQAVSFLIASPLVNEIAIVMLAGTLGWSIAGFYAAAGLVIAVVAGLVLSRFIKPDWSEVSPSRGLRVLNVAGEEVEPTMNQRFDMAISEVVDIIKTTWIYVLIGVAAGALAHGWLPTSFVAEVVSWGPVVGVLGATALGVPLYSGIATVVPIIGALADKGMSMGTLVAFAMSVTALSLPEAILLRKVMKPKLLAAFFGSVAFGIVLVGISMNFLVAA